MITPIRGRKRRHIVQSPHIHLLKDDNPDKGTETTPAAFTTSATPLALKDDNPDKGTETVKASLTDSV